MKVYGFLFTLCERRIFCLYLYLSVHIYWGTFAIVGVCESVESSKLESNLKFKLFKAKIFSLRTFFLLEMSFH